MDRAREERDRKKQTTECSKVRAVYKKYSKIENGGVALVSPAKSLLGSAAADSKKP
ncbi:hypothetical protein F2Q68_00034909 [Brassica cretica]|uniref:Uncharacterized protein n=1 Tax=Brassica cretica TaxID=69181 RepID=A0A8S9H6E2_BRACR|nr:hypothetical protein F2Q68_00034909 [Brassica cretica]